MFMKCISRYFFFAAVLALAVCVFALPTFADSESVSGCSNCNGYTFSATLTPTGTNTYSISYTITNVSGATANPYNWSLTLFAHGSDITSASGLTMSDGNQGAYILGDGKSNNGNTNCNGAIGGAVCLEPSGTHSLSTLSKGQSLTFNFNITCSNCTELAQWDFLSSGNCVANANANCYAISVNGSGGSTGVPEPSSWVLYGATLLVLGGAFWRKSLVRFSLRPPLVAGDSIH
jgi:hypothetical protein